MTITPPSAGVVQQVCAADALARTRVDRVLRGLGEMWSVLRAVPSHPGGLASPVPFAPALGRSADHVLIGPGGVLVITTTAQTGRQVLSDAGRLVVDGVLSDHHLHAGVQTRRVERALTRATDLPVTAASVLVVVDAAELVVVDRPRSDRVRVLGLAGLAAAVSDLGVPSSTDGAPVTARLQAAADDPRTWCLAEPAGV